MNYGFVASKIDGTEKEFKETEGIQIPEKYSYKKYLPEVLNQGNKPICVPCSLSAYINWDENLENETVRKDNNVNLSEIFKNRTEKTDDGMSFKDAFYYIRHHGVETDNGNYKIDKYAKVGSELALKQAIIINGPCVGGLPVYNSRIDEFWDKEKGDEFLGGHAVSIVGYNNDGFIIRNSWGNIYGIDGYYVIPYEDFNTFIELWTVL